MPSQLYNILVPIDFNARNRWAITKAIELSNSFGCNIHLVHVRSSRDKMFTRHTGQETAYRKLELLRAEYKQQLCGNGRIEISVLSGNHSQQLLQYIQKYEMDLVITGLSRFNLLHRVASAVSISRLATKSQLPVLAVRSSGLVCHYKKIVLPVSGEVPIRQIRLAALLGRAFRSTVYFVSLRQHADGENKNLLAQALEVVQSISTVPVQSFLLEGKNLAQSTLDFSRKINADLIMVNPVRDFQLPGLWNRITNKLISYASRIPVVTVASGGNREA
ncbi:MAG: universal stress protein [Chitinophagaceae bacterium]|nr:universal stress protein [Chitinophagaceae bacterium]